MNQMKERFAHIALVVASIWMPVALADDAGSGKSGNHPVFSDLERQVVEAYYDGRGQRDGHGHDYDPDDGDRHMPYAGKKGKSSSLPPGLARKDALPPGLEMQLQRNGTLPPGLEKRDLPDDLAARLPMVPPGYRRVLADDDLILLDTATGVIADIIYDVVVGR